MTFSLSHKELTELITSIIKLLQKNEFYKVDNLLKNADKTDTLRMTCLLRTTFTARTYLPNWSKALKEAEKHDINNALRGLGDFAKSLDKRLG